jgi:hypothetical protein
MGTESRWRKVICEWLKGTHPCHHPLPSEVSNWSSQTMKTWSDQSAVAPQRLFDAARTNPTVRQAIDVWRAGGLPFEQALILLVDMLARQNDELIAEAVNLKMMEPGSARVRNADGRDFWFKWPGPRLGDPSFRQEASLAVSAILPLVSQQGSMDVVQRNTQAVLDALCGLAKKLERLGYRWEAASTPPVAGAAATPAA